MASVRHLELEKFRFLSNSHPRNGNLHLRTKFDRNRIIHDWGMELKLFSKWRPSTILNLRKLPFWSHDRYLHVILHLLSDIRINRPIGRRYIAKIRFSIRLLSAILNLKHFDFFWSNCNARNVNLHLCTKFDQNRIIRGWDILKKLSSGSKGPHASVAPGAPPLIFGREKNF